MALTGCSPGLPTGVRILSRGGDMDLLHDDVRGVTCWVVYRGISCLPDAQLKAVLP